MPAGREEFGPTLPELLAPRVRRLPPAARVALGALAVAVLVVLAWLVLRPTPGQTAIVVRKPFAFNLITAQGVQRVAPRGGELLRLQAGVRGAPTFPPRPLAGAPHPRGVTPELTFMASGLHDRIQDHLTGLGPARRVR